MVGIAQPVRIPPLRTLKAKPPKYGPVPETDFESYPTRQPGSSTRDTVVQRSASKNLMPSPDLTFDGIANLCGCYPPDTEGDVGPNHYMEWVNAHYAIYTKTGTQVVPPTTGNTIFTGRPFCGSHNNGDPIVLYDQFAQRWMVSTARARGRSTSASRSRIRAIRPPVGARTSSSCTRRSSTTIRSSASGPRRTRTR
jgi:hypothetical protein